VQVHKKNLSLKGGRGLKKEPAHSSGYASLLAGFGYTDFLADFLVCWV
jgi:hypothetical protein